MCVAQFNPIATTVTEKQAAVGKVFDRNVDRIMFLGLLVDCV